MNRWEWAGLFLKEGGFPDTTPNRTAVVGWATAEGSTARANPLDTTLGRPGATDYNSVHVRNYPTLEVGLEATLATLAVHAYGYPEIRAALHAGDDAIAVARAVDRSQWGTHNTENVVHHMQTNQEYAQMSGTMPVTGTPPAVEPQGQPTPAPTPAPQGEPVVTDPAQHDFHSSPEFSGGDGEVIASLSAPGGGGWLIFRDGSVWTVEPAPFFGAYSSLDEKDRKADPLFKGAVAGADGGYILIHDSWTGGQAGLYHFGPATAAAAAEASVHELPEGVSVNP